MLMLKFGFPVAECPCRSSVYVSSVPIIIWLLRCEVICLVNAYVILQGVGAGFVFCSTGVLLTAGTLPPLLGFDIRRLVWVYRPLGWQKHGDRSAESWAVSCRLGPA